MDDVMTTVITDALQRIAALPLDERVAAINTVRRAIHAISPFNDNPVDLIQWVKSDSVTANDYNPNTVAPPEMALLAVSITEDGYTQPIVTYPDADGYTVVDGFHRNRVGRENADIAQSLHGYLPIVEIRASQSSKDQRMASTIRHNRARGKHGIDAMSSIVDYLAKKKWSDARIAKELGMDPDEVLRHRQMTGLAAAFADREFSEAWEPYDG